MRKIWIGIGIVAILALAIVLVVTQTKEELEEIKIGAILTLTGKGATYGESVKNGIELALEEVNLEPHRKMKIKILYEDSLSDAKTAVSAFNKLIEINKVPVVIGPVLSNEVLASAPIANEKGVIILNPSAGAEDIRKAGDYIFRNRESALPQAYKIAELSIKNFGHNNVIILYSNSPNGSDYMNAFKQRFEELGGKVLLVENFDEGTTDFRTQILKVKEKKPQGVYLAGLVTELGYILKQSRELGLNTQFFASAGIESSKLFEIAGDAAEGVIFGSPAFDPSSNETVIRDFVAKYKNKFGLDPDFFAANAYDALKMIVQSIDQKGYTADGIKNALYRIKNYPGVGGLTTFDEDGEVTKPVRVKIIKNNQFQPL